MRRLMMKYRWPLLGACALAIALAIGVAATASRHDTGASTPGSQTTRSLAAYEGIGSWVDLWDAKAWRDPEATVQDMADHGVRTVFVQTGNAKSKGGISNPAALAKFITEAHARDMYVVTWYLPTLKAGSVDYERVIQAIEFTTEDGQRADSFALDIESTAVKPFSLRNRNLAELSRKIRARVGPDYTLGGIIPSPVGIEKQTGFWDVFPYADVARDYDVLLPMAYHTYDAHTAKQARTYARSCMRILRAQPGCSEIPVHLIGGIASKASAPQMKAFAKVARVTECMGVSMYDWAGMSEARWEALGAGWKAQPE